MEVKLNICKLGGEKSCAIRISDATTDFLPEDSSTPVFQRFKRSEVKSIDVVRFNAVNETKILRVFISDIDLSNVFEIKEDGWYDVHHIVLPTKEWFDKALEDGGMIYTYDTVYYIDNEKFYKYKDAVTTEICIEEILERNPLNTTISVACQNHFSIFYLMGMSCMDCHLQTDLLCCLPVLDIYNSNRTSPALLLPGCQTLFWFSRDLLL